jgi:hypothetical protein
MNGPEIAGGRGRLFLVPAFGRGGLWRGHSLMSPDSIERWD